MHRMFLALLIVFITLSACANPTSTAVNKYFASMLVVSDNITGGSIEHVTARNDLFVFDVIKRESSDFYLYWGHLDEQNKVTNVGPIVEGGSPQKGRNPKISPSGNYILFSQDASYFVLDLGKSSVSKVEYGSSVLTWEPRADRLVSIDYTPTLQVNSYDLQGTKQILWSDDELTYDWVDAVDEIALSPSGDRLAFILEPELYKSEVYLLDFGSAQVTQVTNTPDIVESNLEWVEPERFSFRSDVLKRDGGLAHIVYSDATGTCVMSLSEPVNVWDTSALDTTNQSLFVSFGGIYLVDNAKLGPLEVTDVYKCPSETEE